VFIKSRNYGLNFRVLTWLVLFLSYCLFVSPFVPGYRSFFEQAFVSPRDLSLHVEMVGKEVWKRVINEQREVGDSLYIYYSGMVEF
jgi:hypothetical protein